MWLPLLALTTKPSFMRSLKLGHEVVKACNLIVVQLWHIR